MSNYQDGFANGVTVRGIPLSQAYPGKIFWVNSSSVIPDTGVGGVDAGTSPAAGGKGTYNRPFATIDYAIGKTTANRGDVIAVMPGYSQDITGAAGIALDVAGVAIIGLGSGSLRPQLTGTATASTFTITAANCAIINLEFVGGVIDQTTFLSLSAAALGASVENCRFTDSTNLNWLDAVTLTTLCHDVSFIGCRFNGNDAQNNAMITGTAHDRLYIEDCTFYQNVAQATEIALIAGTAITSSIIKNCSFRSNVDEAIMVNFSGTCTGLITHCYFSSIDDGGAITAGITASGMQCFECYFTGEADKWGLLGGMTAIYT